MNWAFFTVQYEGRCPVCGNALEPGQKGTYAEVRGTDSAIHYSCQRDLDQTKVRPEVTTVCPDCFLVHAGECL